MPSTTNRYSLTELADLAGVTPRTVRYYLSQGLLPSPGAVGPGVTYGDDHLDRLRLIRRLQREHLPLAEIRHQLEGLDTVEIAELAGAAASPADATPQVDPEDSALDYVRRLLNPTYPTAALHQPRLASEAPAPLLKRIGPPPPASAPAAEPPSTATRSQWERIDLAPDVELHVRRPLSRHQSKKVDRLVSIARELLEEEPS